MGTHRFVIEGTEYEVEIGPRSGHTVSVTVNGKAYEVQLVVAPTPAAVLVPSTAPVPAPATPAAQTLSPPAASNAPGRICAPISGVVVRIPVKPGQSVRRGDLLLVVEAMKMENEIFAPVGGIVESVTAQPQQDVRQGDLLLTIRPS